MTEILSPTRILIGMACFACYCNFDGALAQESLRNNVHTAALEMHDNLAPVLIADIGGTKVPLQFDLGSSNALMLQKSVLDAIEAVPTGNLIKQRGTGGVFEVPTYRIPRLQIADLAFTDVIAQLDAPRAGYKPAEFARGFLGTGLLKANAVVLDYKRRRMTLLPSKDAAFETLCRGPAVSFLVTSPKWHGEAVTESDTDFGRVTLWWDTGSPATVLSSSAIHARPLQTSTERLVTHRFMLGGSNFGPWTFDIWQVSLPGFDGFIGDDFFKKHRVCIDFPGNRVVIGS